MEGPSPYGRKNTAQREDAWSRQYDWDEVDEQDSSPDLLLGRYSILETRASGGCGKVQVCWDTRLQRRVAIKLIPLADPDDPNILASSVNDAIAEARTASMLGHPNVVTVLDFESDADYAYLVMEYINGLTLTELMQRVEGGVLTFDECAHILNSVSSALAFAHENGVLHLDIKPSNILIDRMGTVKLSDFGMAALASAAGYGGARGGTVGYMPPEQIAGDMVDERCDLFALAVVMWQALTGINPFAANTAGESFDKIRKGPSPRLSKLEPELAGDVEYLFDQALNPDPAGRMASVARFGALVVDELGDCEAGQESLRRLLDQLADDEEETFVYPREHIPVAVRAPWLESALIRIATAACCGVLCWQFFEAFMDRIPMLGTAQTARIVSTAAASILGAALPSVAGLAMCFLLAATFVLGPFAASYPAQSGACAILTVFVASSWWLGAGRRRILSGLSLLAGSAFSQPLAPVSLAGWGLEPLSALATASFSWFLGQIVDLSLKTGFHVGLVIEGIAALLRTPSSWIWLAGIGISACICSLLCGRGRTWMAILGQVLGAALVVLTATISRTVENGGIWMLPDRNTVLPAVFFCLSVSVVILVFGPPQPDQEVN